jgi:hypothetical protein
MKMTLVEKGDCISWRGGSNRLSRGGGAALMAAERAARSATNAANGMKYQKAAQRDDGEMAGVSEGFIKRQIKR